MWMSRLGGALSTAFALGLLTALVSSVVSPATAGVLASRGAETSETRVALVIGNSNYTSIPTLANPKNDADDVSAALRYLGFEVTEVVNADRAEMQRRISEFEEKSAAAGVSLFYYAGHGLQAHGHNYLVPVDAELETPEDVDQRTIHFDEIHDALANSGGIRLVFLDACRDNPLKTSDPDLRETGLAPVSKAVGLLIAYSTQPNNGALDGVGRNSPFAQALLAHIATPGLDVSNMMIAVRRDVIAATGGLQVPHDESTLTRQFYFFGDHALETSPEMMLWRLAGGQRDPMLLQIYLDRYPRGAHAEDARALLRESVARTAPGGEPAGEGYLWSLALSARAPALVELYIARYPNGAHVANARDLLVTLRAGEAGAREPGILCERLTTHPNDATASTPGVDKATLLARVVDAIDACGRAVKQHPENPHYLALLARATFVDGRFEEAVSLYRKAADAGDARAMVSLAWLEEKGERVPKDIDGAYSLYEKAAARGNADAAINLGTALVEGKWVRKDVPRAFALFKHASEAGSARATLDMAVLIEKGLAEGTPSEALNLFKQAARLAEGRLPQAYLAAAIYLDEGRRGVPKNAGGAADLLLRCIAAGSPDDDSRDDASLECLNFLTAKASAWSPDTVKAVQSRLNAVGYYAGPIDGKTGPSMAPAIKRARFLGIPEIATSHSGANSAAR